MLQLVFLKNSTVIRLSPFSIEDLPEIESRFEIALIEIFPNQNSVKDHYKFSHYPDMFQVISAVDFWPRNIQDLPGPSRPTKYEIPQGLFGPTAGLTRVGWVWPLMYWRFGFNGVQPPNLKLLKSQNCSKIFYISFIRSKFANIPELWREFYLIFFPKLFLTFGK